MIPLIQLLHNSPPFALALIVCLATSLWSALLCSHCGDNRERFLVGFIGLISIYEGLRILKDAGFEFMLARQVWSEFSTLIISLLFLLALVVLKTASREHRKTKEHLRLVEATDSMGMFPDRLPAISASPK